MEERTGTTMSYVQKHWPDERKLSHDSYREAAIKGFFDMGNLFAHVNPEVSKLARTCALAAYTGDVIAYTKTKKELHEILRN